MKSDWLLQILLVVFGICSAGQAQASGLQSFDTGYTICKVRTGRQGDRSMIVGSSYEGTVLGISFDGTLLWQNKLSGFMNHDLWCADLDGDGHDEVLAANADGTLYCLDAAGKLLWRFKQNDAPMNSVCVIHRRGIPYVVCGGYDTKIYYLSGSGALLKTIPSSSYSQQNPWHPYPKSTPPDHRHTANFIRPVRRADGSEILAVHGVIHTMAILARGSVYLFEPCMEKPFKVIDLGKGRPLGECRTGDIDGDGNEEILLGGTGLMDSHWLINLDPNDGKQHKLDVLSVKKGIEHFGYRVVQPEVITLNGEPRYVVLFGSRLLLIPPSLDVTDTEVLASKYSFHDLWQDRRTGRIVFASAQSGGSCVHVLNTQAADWKEDYQKIDPPGKMAAILKNTAQVRTALKNFEKPAWERDPRPVYLMTEGVPKSLSEYAQDLTSRHKTPVFLRGTGVKGAEVWDRSSVQNERYRNRRDSRRKYYMDRDTIVQQLSSKYGGGAGIAFWGGHGNDPYMFHLDTIKAVIDRAQGKKTVLIYPELEDHSDNFAPVLEDYFYPLAEYCRHTQANIFVRSKHIFWQSNIYLPMWSRLLSGEFADVFVPAMEETTDKSMELSVAARMGVWCSGAVDAWGSRCARDNTSFDRLRQHSHQMVPNHFLRMLIYHLSLGSQYLNNFSIDQHYISLYWELIAKGALYVPKRSELLSLSPVHLSMIPPDEHYLEEGNNTKWTTFYDQDFEEKHPFVFSRLNGTWPGAAVTDWDFSRYAAGVKDRRLNFLPPYENGLVLITPPQQGRFADPNAPRGKLTDHLHSWYRDMMQEYYTDGRLYYSADGKQTYVADEYYRRVEDQIKNSARQLPLHVTGDVAWVVAQTAPKHLRLTLIDSGYINPQDRKATVQFHRAQPNKITDLLSSETFACSDTMSVSIDVPCGLFRFIDIELRHDL